MVSSIVWRVLLSPLLNNNSIDDHPHFLSLAKKLADALRNTIFVDQVVYSYAQKQEILDLLEEHITENLVKVASDGSIHRQCIS